jgi:hypothetical protein
MLSLIKSAPGHGLVDGALADAVAQLGAVLLVRLKNEITNIKKTCVHKILAQN